MLRLPMWTLALAWAATGARAEGRITLHNLTRHSLVVGLSDDAAPTPPTRVLRCPTPDTCWTHDWNPGCSCWVPPDHALTFRLERLEGDLEAEIVIRDLEWQTRLPLFGLTIRAIVF